jgi:MFS family permease
MPQGVFNSIVDSREYKWRWWALIGASLAVFMAALDSNVVNVALPIMSRDFHVDQAIRWVVLSYVLPTTALLGAFGALSDILGRRRITLIGVTVMSATPRDHVGVGGHFSTPPGSWASRWAPRDAQGAKPELESTISAA